MKKLVLGTLICLAACGEFQSKFGPPEKHAVPQIAPDKLGLTAARVLQSSGRHIRFVQPEGWELYEFPSDALESGLYDIDGPNSENHLSGIFFHPDDRVLCHVVSEVVLTAPGERPRGPEDFDRQIAYIELQATFSGILGGFIDEAWAHPDDAMTPTPINEEQWYYIIWNEDYPAIGFGVAETREQTSKHAFCYWLDGARGDNEVELLTEVRGAVRFVGVD